MISVMTSSSVRLLCCVLILLGLAARFYGLNDPWKTHDHYNFGGVMTTVYTECMKQLPLSVSRGVVHRDCDTPTPAANPSQSPVYIFATAGWTTLFGSAEWSYRLFTLTFSALSVLMMFLIGRRAGRTENFPWLAAAFQATFLGGMYFGTHLDFMSEFTVFFCLLTAWLALCHRWTIAGITGIVAGLTAWPGFFIFPPLLVSAIASRKGIKRIAIFTFAGAVVCLSLMAYLLGNYDLIAYLKMKILSPGYLPEKEQDHWLALRFAKNFVVSQSRLLGPFFAGLALYELLGREGGTFITGIRNFWKDLSRFQHAVLLSGGAGIVYAILGLEFVMIHIYLYLFLVPGLALLAARFAERIFNNELAALPRDRAVGGLILLLLLTTALYPYGIYKTNTIHDALTSAAMIIGVLVFLTLAFRTRVTAKNFAICIAVASLANISQLINYRNEPDTERSFCLKAKEEHARTGQPVITREPRSMTKDLLYCRGIPIQYE